MLTCKRLSFAKDLKPVSGVLRYAGVKRKKEDETMKEILKKALAAFAFSQNGFTEDEMVNDMSVEKVQTAPVEKRQEEIAHNAAFEH
jgi:hypothetical protein